MSLLMPSRQYVIIDFDHGEKNIIQINDDPVNWCLIQPELVGTLSVNTIVVLYQIEEEHSKTYHT